MADETRIDRLAHRIAYAASCSQIDALCDTPQIDPTVTGGPWYDKDSACQESRDIVEQAVAYLTARHLIVVHPVRRRLFRVLAEGHVRSSPVRKPH